MSGNFFSKLYGMKLVRILKSNHLMNMFQAIRKFPVNFGSCLSIDHGMGIIFTKVLYPISKVLK